MRRNPASESAQVTPIPEILNLRNHKVSGNIFEQYDSREIAKNLILRIQNEEAKEPHSSNPIYDFYKDTSIKTFFPQRFLGSILKEGFLNAWQTHHGNQWVLENALIDMTFPHDCCEERPIQEALEVEPKYGYLSMDVERPGIWKTRLDPTYGEIVAVFKDDIKSRTTFTPGNSATRIHKEDPNIIPLHSLSYKMDKLFPEPNTGDDVRGHQWEAQIWGALTKDDVAYFMIDCPFIQKKIDPDDLELLKETKIPIYQCGTDADLSRVFPQDKIAN